MEGIGPNSPPWCLTVSFVNPHDREFFPAGTEFLTVYELFQSTKSNPKKLTQMVPYYGPDNTGPQVPWEEDALKSPRSYGYPTLPPNWESEVLQTLQAHCPGRPQHNGRDDFFVWHGRGYWSCKITSPTIDDLI